jgi:hypothetical protein
MRRHLPHRIPASVYAVLLAVTACSTSTAPDTTTTTTTAPTTTTTVVISSEAVSQAEIDELVGPAAWNLATPPEVISARRVRIVNSWLYALRVKIGDELTTLSWVVLDDLGFDGLSGGAVLPGTSETRASSKVGEAIRASSPLGQRTASVFLLPEAQALIAEVSG